MDRIITLKIILTSIVLLSVSLVKAQDTINYNEISKDIVLNSCGNVNLEKTETTYDNLTELDTNKITAGLSRYYSDLGMTLFLLSVYKGEAHYLDDAIENYKKSIQIEKKNGNAYHELAFIYFNMKKDTINAKKYIRLYKKYTKEENQDVELIEKIEKK